MSTPPQDVLGIVKMIAKQRAAARSISLRYRTFYLTPNLKGANFRIQKYVIEIDKGFALTGNPIEMIDTVLNAVDEFDNRAEKERMRSIILVQSQVLKWCAYLERAMTEPGYDKFLTTLQREEIPPFPPEDLKFNDESLQA